MNDTGINVADNLPVDVLWEILTRLGCTKSAVRCKAVSKCWLRVVSSPQFMGRLFRNHIYGDYEATKSTNPHPFGLIIRPRVIGHSKGQLLYPKKEKEMTSDFSGHFLPNLFSRLSFDQGLDIKITATCNDLILWGVKSYHMYICNPQTMQLVALPPPPRSYRRTFDGFACDPYYTDDDKQVIEYSVVMVNSDDCESRLKNPLQFEAQIFSSQIGRWEEVMLWSPKPFKAALHACRSLFNDGKLYFYSGESGMLSFNPIISSKEVENGGGIRCHFIDWPPDYVVTYSVRRMIISLCQGNLRLTHNMGTSLSVWDLKDHGASEWHLQYKVDLTEFVARDSSLQRDHLTHLILFGFNYFDDVTLYIFRYSLVSQVVSCNLKTKRLQSVFTIPDESKTYLLGRGFDFFTPYWLML